MHYFLNTRRMALALFFLLCPLTLSAHGIKVLVFTKTAGFAHGSIPAGITALNQLATAGHFEITQTADSATFISQLATTDVVVFLSTTGDVFDNSQQDAFQAWYRNGGAYVGIHAASDTEHGWPWYIELVGAEFANHPAVQVGTLDFLDQSHAITDVIDPATGQRVTEWTVTDEWYNFTTSPRGRCHVLAHLNEAIASANPEEPARPGTTGGTHGNDHPIMWCQEFDGGRSAYLAPGHRDELYSDPVFRGLILNAIEWVGGSSDSDSGATIDANYEKVVLDNTVSNPMSIDIDTTGKVYLVERKGAVKVHNQTTGQTRIIGSLSPYSGGEYGLLGITLAPDFAVSRHLYILWSPASGNNNRLSRFTLNAAGDLDPASEVSIIEYFTNRNAGHHQAGSIAFAPDGNLVMSLGDNTWASAFSPRNDTSIANDARKGSPNSNDLRGGIVRIRPNVGGGPPAHPNYTIPGGNLYPEGTPLGRPEIYTKGARNCFRLAVDPHTGWVYYGDVGPDHRDASTTNPFEGTRGHDEFNQVKAPGWFGWPYFLGDNKPYRDGAGNPWTTTTLRQDLATYFTVNSFLSNGGQAGNPALLPDPTPAWIWYADNSNNAPPQFSELGSGGGRCAMAGAVYAHAPGKNFPAYYNRSVFIMEWSRNRIYDIRTRPDGSILEITRFAPHLSFDRPLEMKFGPDGAMYLIEWGTEFGTSESAGAKLVKVQYTQAAATPVAIASSDFSSGSLPLTVNFSSAGSFDPDSEALTFAWDFDGDQIVDSTAPNPPHTFTSAGTYAVQLTVTDADQLFARANLTIHAGNNAPALSFNYPENFSFFDWGDQVNFSLSVTDAEDGSTASGTIPAAAVLFEGSLGHDDHQHNEIQLNTTSGSVIIPRDAAHGFDEDLGFVFDAFYTDLGAPGVQSIQGNTKVILQAKVTQAQTRDGQSGTTTTPTLDPVGGVLDVTSIDHGDHIFFGGLNLTGIDSLHLRVSAQGLGGNIEIRQDSPGGNLIGTAGVSDTGSTYRDFSSSLQDVLPGSHDLYFVFTRTPGSTDLMRLNWINFRGTGATHVPDRPRLTGTAVTSTNTLRLVFNQAMDLTSLGNPANYAIDKGATVTAVTPIANQSSVILSFTGLIPGDYHTLNLTGLMDLAGDGISSGTRATFLNLQPLPPEFVIGLNAGGPSFTDTSGNLYLADTTPVNLPSPVTVLADMTTSGSPAPANASHFIVGDPNVNSVAVVNLITDANPTSPVALTGTNITGVTFTNTGANGIFSTGNGGFVDGVPLLDGYIFESSVNGSTATINGLGGIPAGTPVTLTLWGTGDTPNSDTQYTVQYDGSTVGTTTTDYDAIGPSPANTAVARASFTIQKIPGVDSITIIWGKGSSDTAGFGAFSLTAPNGPNSSTSSYFTSGSAFSTSNPIAGTEDDGLYQTERWSSNAPGFGFAIPLPNGEYQVMLRFAEINFNTSGSRDFNARIEGGPNLFSPNLDLVARVGSNHAFDETFDGIIVNDGTLNVDLLKGTANNPKISAIGVFRQSGPGSIPDPSFATFLVQQPGANFNAESDVDQDGLSALLEYALGGSEETQDAARLPQLLKMASGDFEIVFTRPEGLPDLSYTLQASNDLQQWVPITPLVTGNSLGNSTGQVRCQGLIPAAQAAALDIESSVYFRLVVSLTSITP